MILFFFLLALSLYLLGTAGYIVYIVSQRKPFARVAYGILWAGFAAHSLAIAFGYYQTGYFPVRNLRESLSFFAWAVMGAYLIIQLRFNVRVLGSFLSPLAAIMMISSSFLPVPTGAVNPILRSFWLILHVVVAFAGNGIFAIAFLSGIMYLIQESRIKSKQLGAIYHRLPSLETLDALNYQCLIVGFPLMTLGLVSGSLYAHYTLGSFWRWDPKEVWSLITWLLYAALLHGRLVSGWRGRRSALLSILFFLVLVFSFLGMKFLVQGYHTFSAFQQG
ncbi:MAG: c-type cytochrome biogenesis protein CcsB [Deltaproteobacteria bacterium]|nr:c-type cytochrome biogenesis protein CcsB [Deltaproteobacteria bacterium]